MGLLYQAYMYYKIANMDINKIKQIIKEEVKRLNIQGGEKTGDPFEVTPVGTPKDSGGNVSACTQDYGCCDWSIPIIKYIYGIEVKWEACCYGNGTLPC